MGRLLGIAIWVITILSVWMFVSGKWWFPPSISEHGPRYDSQFMITIIVVGISFAAAQIGLGWVVWKFRDSGDKERATYSHGNNRLEIVWTIVTAVIFISLAVMGQRVWAQLNLTKAPAGAYQGRGRGPAVQLEFSLPGKRRRLWPHRSESDRRFIAQLCRPR